MYKQDVMKKQMMQSAERERIEMDAVRARMK